jgi:hypothetical protein
VVHGHRGRFPGRKLLEGTLVPREKIMRNQDVGSSTGVFLCKCVDFQLGKRPLDSPEEKVRELP